MNWGIVYLFLTAVSLVAGIALAFYTDFRIGAFLEWLTWSLLVAGVGLVLVVALLVWRRLAIVPLMGLFVLFGILLSGDSVTPPQASWIGVPEDGMAVVLEGEMLSDARLASSESLLLDLDVRRVSDSGDFYREAYFPILVFADSISNAPGRNSDSLRYGDLYRVRGRFKAAEDPTFDFAGSLSVTSVEFIASSAGNPLRRWLAAVRDQISANLVRVLPSDVGGLAAAIVVGDRKRLPPEVTEAFRNAGLSHVLAISGLHIALLGGLVLVGAVFIFGRRWFIYLVCAFGTVWVYSSLAGFSPSVTRAAIMFSMFLLARLFGRQGNVFTSVGLAATIMVALEPAIIDSISFRLSFGAVLGIALVASRVTHIPTPSGVKVGGTRYHLIRLARGILAGLITSVTAVAFTAPIVLSVFNETSLWGPLSTLLVSPVLPFFIVPAIVTGLVGFVWDPLANVLGWVPIASGEYILAVARLFSGWNFAVVEFSSFPLWLTFIWYAVLIMIGSARLIFMYAKRAVGGLREPQRNRARILAFVSVGAIVLWFGLVGLSQDRYLIVRFPRTSSGDMVYIEAPSGLQVLIDGGRRRSEAVEFLDGVLPFWDRSIDLVVATHPDADHIGGLPLLLDRYAVSYVIDAGIEHNTALASEWREKASSGTGGVALIRPRDGMVIDLENGITLEVLWSGLAAGDEAPINDSSIVMSLRYNEFSLLLTGDITSPIENTLAQTIPDEIDVDVLKVAHHGSTTSSSAEFLAAVTPEIAIIQAGDTNPYGHPNPTIVERLVNALPDGAEQLWVTNSDGMIELISNGRMIWLTPEVER